MRGSAELYRERRSFSRKLEFGATPTLLFYVKALIAARAGVYAIASFTDTQLRSLPLVKFQILKFGLLERLWSGDDKVILLLNVTADLEPVFTWNTKQLFVFVAAEYSLANTRFNQIVLWDTIIEKEDTKIQELLQFRTLAQDLDEMVSRTRSKLAASD